MSPEAVQMLMRQPPGQWEAARRRLAVLARYEALVEPTMADVEHGANALRLTVRTFYRLLAAYRAGRAGRYSKRGFHSSTPAATADVIEQVLMDLGPEATDALVHEEAIERCNVLGLPKPSLSAIRSRTGRRIGPIDLRSRLRRDCDLVLESCPLDLGVSNDAVSAGAVLTTLHDARRGSVLRHALHVGFPDASELVDAMAASAERELPPVEGVRLIATHAALRPLAPFVRDLLGCGLVLDLPGSAGLKIGAAAVPAMGRRLGKIPFAPFRDPGVVDTGTTAPIDLARRVVDELIRDLDLRNPPRATGRTRTAQRVDGAALAVLANRIAGDGERSV